MRLDLAASTDGTIFAATGEGLYRSEVGNKQWNLVTGGLPKAGISGLVLSKEGSVYAATLDPQNALYKSTDRGRSWKGLGLGGKYIWHIIVEPGTQEQTIYCGTLGDSGGVFKTINGGGTWATMSQGVVGKTIIGMAQGPDKTLFCSNYTN
jgi:photosystem II stability/assembly factor-like uncharacterized protein